MESLAGWTWTPRRDDWDFGLQALESYLAIRGDALVPLAHKEGTFNVGRWVVKTRIARRRGTLAQDRVRALEALPRWSWDPIDDAWRAGFAALLTFARREGHARPAMGTSLDGISLGGWVDKQRSAYREGTLQRERASALAAVPGWTWSPFEDDWRRAMASLRGFAEREGHASVPQAHVEDGFRLGAWVTRQRLERRHGELSESRIAELNGIPGWKWDGVEDRWAMGVSHLATFTEREGHARPTASHLEADFPLGSWVASRRAERRRGTLQPDRAATLERLPGWTWGAQRGMQEDDET